MLHYIDHFNNVVVMHPAVPAYYWQNNGLTCYTLFQVIRVYF